MTLAELPEDFTPHQFMLLDKASLDTIDYQVRQWQCQCKGCTNGTKVRDYGISPFFFLHRNSKWSRSHPQELWNNLNQQYWLCSRHWKAFKRLTKSHEWSTVEMKLLDYVHGPKDKLI